MKREKEWAAGQQQKNQEALQEMRRLVPVGVQTMTAAQLKELTVTLTRAREKGGKAREVRGSQQQQQRKPEERNQDNDAETETETDTKCTDEEIADAAGDGDATEANAEADDAFGSASDDTTGISDKATVADVSDGADGDGADSADETLVVGNPMSLIDRLKEKRLLHWVVTHPDDIAASNFLQGPAASHFQVVKGGNIFRNNLWCNVR